MVQMYTAEMRSAEGEILIGKLWKEKIEHFFPSLSHTASSVLSVSNLTTTDGSFQL